MDRAPEDWRQRQEAVVREHMTSENEGRFDDTLATFTYPRYELIGTGQVYDGVDEVKAYYASSRVVFPDQRNEIRAVHHAEGTVVVEFDLLGTHTGSLAGEEPTGRAFRCPMVPSSSSKARGSSASGCTSTRGRSTGNSRAGDRIRNRNRRTAPSAQSG